MEFFIVLRLFNIRNKDNKLLSFMKHEMHQINELKSIVYCGLGSTLQEVVSMLCRNKYIKKISPPDLITLVKTVLLSKLQEK